ncbi:unnamed protein product, partial [Didymodactylos carnosus]
RIQAILDIPQPTTLAQANKFIGKIGWYRKFIPKFAELAAPIHTKKNREFYWHEDQVQAANKLKQVLTDEPLVLKYPHPTAPFILATDASEYAIDDTLKQIIDGQTHYNYFLSRLLTPTEMNYSTIDREALASFGAWKNCSSTYVEGMSSFRRITNHWNNFTRSGNSIANELRNA